MHRGSILLLLAAAVIALAVLPWYLNAIAAQGAGDLLAPRVWLVASYIAAGGVLAAAAARAPSPHRALLGAASSGALLFVGIAGLFSIGLPLLLAGLLAAVATAVGGTKRPGTGEVTVRNTRRATAIAVALLVVVGGVLGLVLTQPGLR